MMVNEIVMANNKNNKDGKEDINDAVQNLKENAMTPNLLPYFANFYYIFFD